ncbi:MULTISPECIES: ATP-binding cassette domain-containing protein [unclassified Brevibacterium]|uniref:ATP-binding cassette domain-containing protein n=1 Tax=unclassified Brevibacterium TaxID=2614124 RepID=UPI00109325E5|nr:ATP-binding cassette domain-containing protein [Brevibacterium sp. S22]TGD29403.1 ATP-binding cassette domain-containing protein [Brevibacterium sp. S22]
MRLTDLVIDYGSTRVGPVDADIPAGTVTVLQGASGSGKTSVCLAMTGFLRPSSGRVDGELGVLVPQNPREWLNPRLTVAEVIEHTRAARESGGGAGGSGPAGQSKGVARPAGQARGSAGGAGAERAGGSHDSHDLLALLDRALLSPELAHHRCGELSGGQAARVCIARALASGIDTIVCDEPTAALDSSNAARIAWLINDLAEAGKTIVWATHDRDLVAATDVGYSFVTL